MAGEFVTLPHPFEPDIEISRQMGNLSGYKAATNCSMCMNKTNVVAASFEDPSTWVGTSHDVLHIAFPVLVTWGVLSGLCNILVLARQVRISLDSYMIGFVVATILLLLTAMFLRLPEYTEPHDLYARAYGYIKPLHDWVWYTSLWILVVMTLERGMSVAQGRAKSVCTPVQAMVVTILIFGVCLVSALPQFWEYDVTETYDVLTNRTLVTSVLSEAADSPEYRVMYYWYTITITIFLPYPLLLVMTVLLSTGMKHTQQTRERMSYRHGTGNILKRKMTEEIHLSRLFIVLILLYLVLTGPFTILLLVERVQPVWYRPQDDLCQALEAIFRFAFYFYFAIEFPLLCSYSDRFRFSLVKTCCCCCYSSCWKKKQWRAVTQNAHR